ncbi:MAG: succinylglutamate desuccinylase/aspartoacylase family protein [Syntrophomonas sp.]
MKKVKHQIFNITITMLLALLTFAVLPVNVSNAQQTRERVVLASGTKYATNLYVIRSGKPGPVVMIVGGVHGNETAGYKAANIVKNYTIKAGTLLVVPEANKLAVEQHRRAASGGADLNRSFPSKTILARSIYSVVKRYHVDWLMDMHEGYDYSTNPSSSSVGQSLIYYPVGNTKTIGLSILSGVNSPITSSYRKFHLLYMPIGGSLARSSGQYLRVHSFIFETCSKESLSTRVNNQLKATNILLTKLNMK